MADCTCEPRDIYNTTTSNRIPYNSENMPRNTIRDYAAGVTNQIASVPVEKPLTIKEMNRLQDELIDKNLAMVYSIRESLIGTSPYPDLNVDRTTLELNFRSNNEILMVTNSILQQIIDILGIK